MTQARGQLLVQRRLQHRLGQLLQQSVRPSQRQALLAGRDRLSASARSASCRASVSLAASRRAARRPPEPDLPSSLLSWCSLLGRLICPSCPRSYTFEISVPGCLVVAAGGQEGAVGTETPPQNR